MNKAITISWFICTLIIVLWLAFTNTNNGVLLAIRDFSIFMAGCFVVWCVTGLNSTNYTNKIMDE